MLYYTEVKYLTSVSGMKSTDKKSNILIFFRDINIFGKEWVLSGGELLFHTMEDNARNNQEFWTFQITGLYLKLDGGRFVAGPT
jgi:hypothetical protein